LESETLRQFRGLPANALYVADIVVSKFMPEKNSDTKKTGIPNILSPNQLSIAASRDHKDIASFFKDIAIMPMPRFNINSANTNSMARAIFRIYILSKLLSEKKCFTADLPQINDMLLGGLVEECWSAVSGRDEWTDKEGLFLELALRDMATDRGAYRDEITNALHLFCTRSGVRMRRELPVLESILENITAATASASSWRDRVLLVHALISPVRKLTELSEISQIEVSRIEAALRSLLVEPKDDADRYSALDLAYAHARYQGAKGPDAYADIVALLTKRLDEFTTSIKPRRRLRYISARAFEGLHQWSGLSHSTLRALAAHVA
jgi:hypothetical protein